MELGVSYYLAIL